MDIKKLRQDRADALSAAKALHASVPNGIFTEEQGKQYDAFMATVASCDVNIKRAEALLDAERTAPTVDVPTQASAGHNRAEDKPWASLGEQLIALKAATINPRNADPRIQAAIGASEGVAAEGGILVDPEFAPGILSRVWQESMLAERCLQMPMTRASMKIKAVDERSRVDGSRFGGIQAFWTAEAALYTQSRPKFREMDVNAHKLTALVYDTEELDADAPYFSAYVNEVVPLELAYKVDAAIAVGTGAGMPLGFVNSPATIVVPKDTNQPSATVSTTNILNMIQRLYFRSLKDAAFFVNPAIIWTQLATLTIGSGTAVKLIYQGPSDEAPYGTLFNVPVIPIEQAAAVGTQGDVMLADLKTYMLAKRQGIRADSSIHVAFLTGENVYRWMMRLDGQPLWNVPLTPANGSVTTSPYVALASRP